MKHKSFDLPLVALFGAFVLASGMFVASATRQIGSIYQTVSSSVPVSSQVAAISGSGSGLSSYYTLNETSGTFAADSAGSNTGTVVGGTWTTGQEGGAVNLDGVDDYINLNSTSLIGTGNLTVCSWFYAKSAPLTRSNIIVSNIQFAISIDTYFDPSYSLAVTNDGNTTVYSGSFAPNTWHHQCTVRSGNLVTIYLDGVVSGTANQNAGTPIASAWPSAIGQYSAINWGNFFGYIDEFRVYDRALSPAEVIEVYAYEEGGGGGGGFGPASEGGGSAASNKLTGWAWSSNIGWISFNSANAGAGAGGVYAVATTTDNPSVYTLGGYAWSPHVGWISFNSVAPNNDVAGCPSGPGVDGVTVPPINGCVPTVSATGSVTGWARVLSMKNEPGGGWLQLSGLNHETDGEGGVTFSPDGTFSGYAWESTVLGWVQFDLVSLGITLPPTPPPPFTVVADCTASPSGTVPSGTDVLFEASAHTVPAGAYVGGYDYSWTGVAGPFSDTDSISRTFPPGPSPVLYAQTKDAVPVVSEAKVCPSITVNTPANTLDLRIGRTTATATGLISQIRQSESAKFALKWTNGIDGYNSCSVAVTNGGIWGGEVNTAIAGAVTGGSIGGLTTAVSAGVLRGTYTFTLTCTDGVDQLSAPPVTLRIVGAVDEEI